MARRKAEELACKVENERRDAQKDVSRLVEEEADVKKKAADLNKKINIKVEQKPSTVDVYEHKRYETNKPVVTEVQVNESEDKSLGAKIVDGVKKLF